MMRRTESFSSVSSAASDEDTMQIFVKNVSGTSSTSPLRRSEARNGSSTPHSSTQPPLTFSTAIPLTVPAATSISTLSALLALRHNLPASDLRLVHAGSHLSSPAATLSELGIPAHATLHMALPLRGGMPPRKIRCSFKDCKDAAQRIVGDCGFCSGHFCGRHRLLEDHKCEGLEDCKKESHERNAERLNAERTVAIKGI